MILKGKLEYHNLFDPIKLFTDKGEINLWDHYSKIMKNLNDKKMKNFKTVALPLIKGYATHGFTVYDSSKMNAQEAIAYALRFHPTK